MSAARRRRRAVSRTRWTAPLVAALLLTGVRSAAADVATLTATRDNTLFEDATGSLSNGAGSATFAGKNGQNLVRRTLVLFDVAGEIPPGAVVSSVVLRLNVSNVSDATPRVYTIHRVQNDWGEGTSSATGGGGAPATPGDATWLCTRYPSAFWTSAGGDFEPIADASQLLGDVGAYTWSAPPMASDVQGWLDGVVDNHGWIIIGDETAAGTARRFDSRENTVAANRPTLTVTYAVTASVPAGADLHGVVLGPWPNPGSGPVRFAFSLPARARIGIAVHDLRGRRVTTVADRTFDAGVRDVEWEGRGADGKALSSGVYFITLSVDGRRVAVRRWVRLE